MEQLNIEWVDVNERLPEASKNVLVLGCDYSGAPQMSLANFSPSRGWVMSGHLNDVCYWIYWELALPECKCQDLAQEAEPLGRLVPEFEDTKFAELNPQPSKSTGWFSRWFSAGE